MDTLLDSAFGTLSLNLLCVEDERGLLLDHVDLGSVLLHCRPRLHHPILREAHVCSRAGLIVLHDTSSGEEVIDHVGAERKDKDAHHRHLSIDGGDSTHFNALIGDVDCLLEVAHVLRGCCLAARARVE